MHESTMTRTKVNIFETKFIKLFVTCNRGYYLQHNNTWHNDIQHNNTQHNDIQNNDIRDNDIQHKNTQHNDIQHNHIWHNDIQLT